MGERCAKRVFRYFLPCSIQSTYEGLPGVSRGQENKVAFAIIAIFTNGLTTFSLYFVNSITTS